MNSFKAKRVSGAELSQQIAGVTARLPPAEPKLANVVADPPIRSRAPRKVQINFQASEEFAELVACEAEKEGSTRRFFARLMRKAGYDVPEADANPPDTRRRRGG